MVAITSPLPAPVATTSASAPRSRVVATSVAVAAAVTACSALVASRHLPPVPTTRKAKRRLSPLAADAVAGAVGEIVQIAVLYPLDTLKVVCQAADCSTRDALTLVMRTHPSWRVLPRLYRGCAGSAAVSAAIGALYLVSFTWAREATASAVAKAEGRPVVRSGSGRKAATPPPTAPPVDAAAVSATVGAVASTFTTSLFESPLELFRHRLQAGRAHAGGVVGACAAAARAGGLPAVYRGYAPFVLKALPYDVAELVSYSLLQDRAAGLGAGLGLTPSATGAAVGALAGAVAVLASMPADCIKLHIELCDGAPPSGARAAAAHYGATARTMFRTGGVAAFFRGLAPRLAEKVPSTCAYWLVVEGVRGALVPLTREDDGGELAGAA